MRTLAVMRTGAAGGVGHRLLDALVQQARDLGVSRVFCLTFEVEFFARHGFRRSRAPRSAGRVRRDAAVPRRGVAEFLDLARVKPNTLGNTRMLLEL